MASCRIPLWCVLETTALGQTTIPVPNTGFVAVATGFYHTCGILLDSSLVCFGNNTYGQITVPAPNSGFVAVLSRELPHLWSPSKLPHWFALAMMTMAKPPSPHPTLALRPSRLAVTTLVASHQTPPWCALVGPAQRPVPAPNSGFVAVAVGSDHTCGLVSNSTLVCFGGIDNYGQTTVPTTQLRLWHDHFASPSYVSPNA